MCGLFALLIIVIFAFKFHWLLGMATIIVLTSYIYGERQD